MDQLMVMKPNLASFVREGSLIFSFTYSQANELVHLKYSFLNVDASASMVVTLVRQVAHPRPGVTLHVVQIGVVETVSSPRMEESAVVDAC